MSQMAFTIEGKITCVRFSSWCNVAFGNALVPQGNLKVLAFVHGAMYSLAMDLQLRQNESQHVLDSFQGVMLFLPMHLCLGKKERWHVLAFLHGVMYFLACASFPQLLAMQLVLVFSFTIKGKLSCIGHVLELSFTIKGMLACVRFTSQCNMVFGNALVHVLKGKIARVSFLA